MGRSGVSVQEGSRVPCLLLHLSDLCAPGCWGGLARANTSTGHCWGTQAEIHVTNGPSSVPVTCTLSLSKQLSHSHTYSHRHAALSVTQKYRNTGVGVQRHLRSL